MQWRAGWRPRELRRAAERWHVFDQVGAAVGSAIRADSEGRQCDGGWHREATDAGGPARRPSGRGWLVDALRPGANDAGRVRIAVEALRWLDRVPSLPWLTLGDDQAGDVGDRALLDRIRSLLAKAQSTSFPAEADAFTAKAQELMLRHSIGAAMLRSAGDRTAPGALRIVIDPPYVDAKIHLLSQIGAAHGCQTISVSGLDIVVVVGFAEDRMATDLLFTSLLLQAEGHLVAAAEGAGPGSPQRSRRYRNSFMHAFAVRVGERLRERAQEVASDVAAHDASLLPVLASKDEAVDRFVHDHFNVRPASPSRAGIDPAGWGSGRRAGDRALLRDSGLNPSSAALPAG
jgi:hypothetical protein